jgi:hypothetical protein
MLDVPAAITICGIFASVASGATANAVDEIDLLIDDQFLRQPLGVLGHRTVVADDDLDLLAGHVVAVLGHVKPHRRGDLHPGRLLRTGHRQQGADFDLGLRAACGQAERRRGEAGHRDVTNHDVCPPGGFPRWPSPSLEVRCRDAASPAAVNNS